MGWIPLAIHVLEVGVKVIKRYRTVGVVQVGEDLEGRDICVPKLCVFEDLGECVGDGFKKLGL